MGLFSSKDDKSVEEPDQQIQETEKEKLKAEGKNRLQNLKKRKRQKLKQQKKAARKAKLKQTTSGKIISQLGEALGEFAEKNDNKKAESLAQAAEKVDGDGKGDTSSALGIGLSSGKSRDLEVEGDLEVQGDLIENGDGNTRKNGKKEIPLFRDDGGIT